MQRRALALRELTLAVLVGCASLVSPARADEASGSDEERASLSSLGVALERARLLPAAERAPAVEAIWQGFNDQAKKDLNDEERRVAAFLSGEIRYSLGDYKRAEEDLRKAEHDAEKTPFADDAAFAAITALEASGRDADAWRAWQEWEKRYPKSPLMAESRLARAWNALRRGAVPDATKLLTAIHNSHTWLQSDTRVVLAEATAAYLDGRPEDAHAALEGGGKDAAATYLRALCLRARGDVLKSAALFQEAADKSPGTPLRDHALLAKANTFLVGKAYRSAADEYGRVAELASLPEVRAEAELRQAASLCMSGDAEGGGEALQRVAGQYSGSAFAARAQFLLGDVLYGEGRHAEAIVELNRVLTDYFQHELAPAAQYRVGRCLDALGRQAEATSTYQAVVSGYPLAPEAPAAAYLAGVGLMEQNRHLAAVPYFQLVIDRYARDDTAGAVAFASAEHQELVEAALCLLELAYHRAGNLGQLAGMPHLMLTRMPTSKSPWRAYALLIDADAMAAMGRYAEAQTLLSTLMTEFPNEDITVRANRLLAWTFAREGKDDLAIQTEEEMLARYAARGNADEMSTAFLHKAHVLMNRKKYREAAQAYEDFLARFPSHPERPLALYQAGLAYHRLDRSGDAVDRWEKLVALDPAAPIAEKAWTRAGDVYFQAEHYEEAKRCYEGLLANFAASEASARGKLRIAQCEYNAGRDAEALGGFSEVISRFPGTREAEEAGRGIELALYRLGQKEDAAEVLTQLVERYPQSAFAADAQFQVAMSLYQKKDFPGAAEAFRRVVSQFPGYSGADRATFLMGDAYAQAGSKEDARQTYEQFLAFFTESELRSTVRFRLGAMRFEEGEYMRAAVDFTDVLQNDPPKEVAEAALYNLALCQRMIGSNEEARASFEQYRSKYGNGEHAVEVAIQMAEIHEQAGDADAALAEIEKALASNPPADRAVELQYRLGLARENRKELDGALRAYQKAIETREKGNAFRLSALARAAAIYEGQGKIDRALAAYRDLIRNAADPELVAAAQERAAQLGSTDR